MLLVKGDPRLKQKSVHTTLEEANKIADELYRIRQENGGAGIAAPQIGYNIRVINITYRGRDITVVNPFIKHKKGTITVIEGCLSVPDYNYFVKRPFSCILYGEDLLGKGIKLHCEGGESSLVNHEVDHLDGILIDKGMIHSKKTPQPETKIAFAEEQCKS